MFRIFKLSEILEQVIKIVLVDANTLIAYLNLELDEHLLAVALRDLAGAK